MNIKSLHIKVSISVAAAALFVVILSSYFFYQRAYESSFADSQRSVEQLLQTVSTTAAIAAYVSNTELARQVVVGLSKNDIVVAAEITANHEIIGREGRIPSGAERTLIALDLTAPFDDQEIVGKVIVLPNTALIIERARNSALATTIGLATQAAVVALLVMFMVYWLMTRPLANLSGGLHRITPGDGNRVDVAHINRSDEIGLLAADINTLLSTVEKMLGEERELRHRVEILEHRFRGIFEDSSAGIFLVSEQGGLITANPAFFKITQLNGKHSESYANVDMIDTIFTDYEKARALIDLSLTSQQSCSEDLRIKSQDSALERWVHCIFSPAGDEKNGSSIEGVIYDITQRKIDEEYTRELAEKDSLTGLPNRQLLEATLDNLVGQPNAIDKGFVVMMIDLDGFKYINDTYGHEAGDEILKVVSDRLRGLVRDTDMVARIGGDEFVILLKYTHNLTMTKSIAQKIVDSQQEPIEIQPGTFEKVGISIGIALYPEHGDNPQSLRRHADQAMYLVKRKGKNSYSIYDPETLDSSETISR